VCVCGWPRRPPLFNKKYCLCFPWLGTHWGLGSGVRGLGQTGGPVLRGSLLRSFLLFLLRSPVCSGGREGRRGRPREASRRGMTPRCLHRGVTLVLSERTPPPPRRRDVIHTHTHTHTATQGDEIHVRAHSPHTRALFSLNQTVKYTHTHSHHLVRPTHTHTHTHTRRDRHAGRALRLCLCGFGLCCRGDAPVFEIPTSDSVNMIDSELSEPIGGAGRRGEGGKVRFLKSGGYENWSAPFASMNDRHMDAVLAHGVHGQRRRRSDMSSCVWTDLLKGFKTSTEALSDPEIKPLAQNERKTHTRTQG